MYHELVAREIQVLQWGHGHEREGDGCPISTDNGIPAKDVINAFWVVRCGTKWEGAGHEAAELLILPGDASPLRVSELDAIAAGLVGAAAFAFRCELGSERGASVSTRSEGVGIQPPGAIQKIHSGFCCSLWGTCLLSERHPRTVGHPSKSFAPADLWRSLHGDPLFLSGCQRTAS